MTPESSSAIEDFAGLARDRALAYVKGLGLAPLLSLRLALGALESAEAPKLSAVMTELHARLRLAGRHPEQAALAIPPAAPPLRRRPLAAEK